MDTSLKCTVPGDIEATITITAKVSTLIKLRDQLNQSPEGVKGHYPIETFRRQVCAAINFAEKHFVTQEGDEEQNL